MASASAQALWADIFRSADKNVDDGKISFQEFVNFLDDDDLTDEQAFALFRQIDKDGSQSIDTDELASFFAKYWGSFEQFFANAETLNTSLSACLDQTFQSSQSDDISSKAMSRLFLRESAVHLNHMTSALRSAHSAMQTETKQISSHPVSHTLSHAADIASRLESELSQVVHKVHDELDRRTASYQSQGWFATVVPFAISTVALLVAVRALHHSSS